MGVGKTAALFRIEGKDLPLAGVDLGIPAPKKVLPDRSVAGPMKHRKRFQIRPHEIGIGWHEVCMTKFCKQPDRELGRLDLKAPVALYRWLDPDSIVSLLGVP